MDVVHPRQRYMHRVLSSEYRLHIDILQVWNRPFAKSDACESIQSAARSFVAHGASPTVDRSSLTRLIRSTRRAGVVDKEASQPTALRWSNANQLAWPLQYLLLFDNVLWLRVWLISMLKIVSLVAIFAFAFSVRYLPDDSNDRLWQPLIGRRSKSKPSLRRLILIKISWLLPLLVCLNVASKLSVGKRVSCVLEVDEASTLVIDVDSSKDSCGLKLASNPLASTGLAYWKLRWLRMIKLTGTWSLQRAVLRQKEIWLTHLSRPFPMRQNQNLNE